jgi:uncharacterized protein
MGKLLIFILAAFAAYLLWKGFRRAPDRGRAAAGASPEGERMVDCSECGVHLPVSEAIQAQGRYFCCEEHRRLSAR